jgi:hypothetical protein
MDEKEEEETIIHFVVIKRSHIRFLQLQITKSIGLEVREDGNKNE